MAKLTERVRFTVPKKAKDPWKAEAALRGMTLSGFLRAAIKNLLADHQIEVTSAGHGTVELEKH